jgi:membrane protein implicated in regulation of membrane protease activity
MSPTILWLIAGAAFIALEVFGVPGIGFLFAGLAALMIGGLVEFDILASDDVLLQFTLFSIMSVASAAMLWKKLKTKRTAAPYSNMVGTEATVATGGLMGNKEGQVKWSGTLMRAQLMENDGSTTIAEGTTVIIQHVDGNLVFVAPKK